MTVLTLDTINTLGMQGVFDRVEHAEYNLKKYLDNAKYMTAWENVGFDTLLSSQKMAVNQNFILVQYANFLANESLISSVKDVSYMVVIHMKSELCRMLEFVNKMTDEAIKDYYDSMCPVDDDLQKEIEEC